MPTVDLTHHHGVAVLTLNNPDYHNCMTHAMWEALYDHAVHLAQDHQLRAVVIQGTGPHFTSGFDLSQLGHKSYDEVNREFALMEDAIHAVESLPVPVMASLRGYCLGGGFELALACDFRIGDNTVQMGIPVARIGIMLSRTFALRLVKVLGLSKTKEVLLTGRLIDAADARMLGVLNEVASNDRLDHVVKDWLARIDSLYPRAVRQAKAAVTEVLPKTDLGQPYFVDAHDFFEAIQRFQRD